MCTRVRSVCMRVCVHVHALCGTAAYFSLTFIQVWTLPGCQPTHSVTYVSASWFILSREAFVCYRIQFCMLTKYICHLLQFFTNYHLSLALSLSLSLYLSLSLSLSLLSRSFRWKSNKAYLLHTGNRCLPYGFPLLDSVFCVVSLHDRLCVNNVFSDPHTTQSVI